MKIFYRGNDTDINQVRVSRLANINKVVWRWLNNNMQHGQYAYQQHRFGVYKYVKTPSPRKILLACWLLMKRQKQERIDLEKEQFIAILVKKDSGEPVGGRANEVGPNAYKPLESVLGEPERAFTVLRGGLAG